MLGVDLFDLGYVVRFIVLIIGRIKVYGIGGGYKQRYRMIDFLRFRFEQEIKLGFFEEKVIIVRYDFCR